MTNIKQEKLFNQDILNSEPSEVDHMKWKRMDFHSILSMEDLFLYPWRKFPFFTISILRWIPVSCYVNPNKLYILHEKLEMINFLIKMFFSAETFLFFITKIRKVFKLNFKLMNLLHRSIERNNLCCKWLQSWGLDCKHKSFFHQSAPNYIENFAFVVIMSCYKNFFYKL